MSLPFSGWTQVDDSLWNRWSDESLDDTSRFNSGLRWVWRNHLEETHYDQCKEVTTYIISNSNKPSLLRWNINANFYDIKLDEKKGLMADPIPEYELQLSRALHFGDWKTVGFINSAMGEYHVMSTRYLEAAPYYLRSILPLEQSGDYHQLAWMYQRLTAIYHLSGDLNSAREYGEKALALYDSIESPGDIYLLARLHKINLELGDTVTANQLFQNSLAVAAATQKEKSREFLLFKAENARSQYKYEEAMKYTIEWTSTQLSNDKTELWDCFAYSELANTYYNNSDYHKGIEAAKLGVKLSEELGDGKNLLDNLFYLQKNYAAIGDYTNAYLTNAKYDELFNSRKGTSATTDLLSQKIAVEQEKERYADSLVNLKHERILELEHQQEVQSEKNLTYAGAAGAVAFLVVAGFLFVGFRRKKKSNVLLAEQKHLVEEKNQEITDSITYAKRIQEAILPPDNYFKSKLSDSFVLYKPKDIVAGDFYWMEDVGDTVIFSAADCTGHGVPGAMVSVVCCNALNRSVREYGILEPGKILDKVNELVEDTFAKSERQVKDGMDLALCSLNGKKLNYAGAHNPLWIVRDGEILETKADKNPIGSFNEHDPFKTHSFDLESGDILYIFSDGYVDQFGGPKGKKFKAKALRKLLLEINSDSMETQRNKIEEAFENWRGNQEQVDDVCMIGVRIT